MVSTVIVSESRVTTWAAERRAGVRYAQAQAAHSVRPSRLVQELEPVKRFETT